MLKRGKGFLEAKKKIESGKRHTLNEAVNLIVATSRTKFDETVDAAIR